MSDIRAFQTFLRPHHSHVRLIATTTAVGLHAIGLAALAWQHQPPVIAAANDTPSINVTLFAPAAFASPTTPPRDTMRPSDATPQADAAEARSVAPILSHRSMTPAPVPEPLVVGTIATLSEAIAPRAAQTGDLGAPNPGPGGQMSASGQMTGRINPQVTDPYPAQVLAWVERHKRYPASALNRSLGGVAVVAVTLDRRGRVMRLNLAQSSGYALLDDAALDVFRRAGPFPRPAANTGWSRRQFEIPIEFRPGQASG